MRIAYLINQYPMASLTFIRREIAALESMGHSVDRFALQPWPDTLIDEADISEAERTRYVKQGGLFRLGLATLWVVLRFPGRFLLTLKLCLSVASRSDRSLLYHLAYLAEACVLREWLVSGEFDHLHVHFASNSTDVAMFAHALGGPRYSFMVHGPEEFDRADGLVLDEKIRRAAFVATISSYARSQIFRWCSVDDWAKVKIVRCGLDPELLDQPLEQPPANRRLVNVGRLCEQKGQLLLIEAAARLAQQGIDFELVLVGDGDMRSLIEASIAEYQLENRVQLVGWVTNAAVQDLLRDSRGLVLASFAEGLPVVIMESLAVGRPVIATWIAGIPELVRDGVNGWLIPPGNVESLATAMAEMLSAPTEKLARMGTHGHAAVREFHDVSREAALLTSRMKQLRVTG